MNAWTRACCLLPLLAVGCALQPQDPFLRAERALQRDDLLRSLSAFDSVPVAHPRYPEARARAAEVERRIRRCHEYILEALMLRGEWRDREALGVLRRAQEQWAREPSLERWIETTERRLEMFGDGDRAPVAVDVAKPAVPHVEMKSLARADDPITPERAPPPPRPEPVAVVVTEQAAVAESDEQPNAVAPAPTERRRRAAPSRPFGPRDVVPTPAEDVAPAQLPGQPRASGGASGARVEDPVSVGMVTVETRLARGEFGEAVGDLIELLRCHPDDLRVRQRLAPLLNQRALLRYGEGLVAQAIADWQRVLQLDPQNGRVHEMLDRAVREQR